MLREERMGEKNTRREKKRNTESIGQSQDKGMEGETSSMTDRCSIVTDKMEEEKENATRDFDEHFSLSCQVTSLSRGGQSMMMPVD